MNQQKLKKYDIFLHVSYWVIILLMIFVLLDLTKQGPKNQIPITEKFTPTESALVTKYMKSGSVVMSLTPRSIEPAPAPVLQTKPIEIANVPFTAQAPFGNWSDIVYEEWCEEASITMAVYWARNEILTPEKASSEIKAIADFEKIAYGTFMDTSIYDTVKTLKKYYEFDQYRLVDDITPSDIVNSLKKGNIVLVPAFGRDLKNKNYTPPGPIPHMLVIIWYDPIKKEFITNDPGTKYGKWFRYDEDVLFNAIWTYPTSAIKIAPPKENQKRHKSMIEVFKKRGTGID